jgi:hypothetical protein
VGCRRDAADRGAAAKQRDHRLGRGDLAGDGAEALVVLDRLDIEQGGRDLGSLAQPGEVVLHAEMDGVADRDHRGER